MTNPYRYRFYMFAAGTIAVSLFAIYFHLTGGR